MTALEAWRAVAVVEVAVAAAAVVAVVFVAVVVIIVVAIVVRALVLVLILARRAASAAATTGGVLILGRLGGTGARRRAVARATVPAGVARLLVRGVIALVVSCGNVRHVTVQGSGREGERRANRN